MDTLKITCWIDAISHDCRGCRPYEIPFGVCFAEFNWAGSYPALRERCYFAIVVYAAWHLTPQMR
jgi:hypothetical protein